MPESLDEQFEKIIQEAISKGCLIECSLEEYIDQLLGWQNAVQVCIDAGKGDIRRRDK